MATLRKPAPLATSQVATQSAALLRLHGAPHLWKLVSGEWEAQMDLLNKHCPFRVEAVLVAPRTVPHAVDVALEAVQRLKATPCQNEWFLASYSTAALVLNAVMPADLEDGTAVPRHDEPASPPTACDDAEIDMHEQCPRALDVSNVGEDHTTILADPDAKAAAGSEADDIDMELWDHVVPCKTCEASKAADIRSALVTQLGKQKANHLLAQTKTAVARDSQGRNSRVLRANGALLKLKPAER